MLVGTQHPEELPDLQKETVNLQGPRFFSASFISSPSYIPGPLASLEFRSEMINKSHGQMTRDN